MQQELTMTGIVHQARRHGLAFVAVVITLGFATDNAAFAQRRGGRMYIPPPTPIDSTPMIDGLNKALKALAETDHDYNGHREKAINHIHTAIRDLELPNARGKSENVVSKALEGTPAASPADSDASLRKAREALFKVHHQLEKNVASKGQIHADAQVRIAIQELVDAQKPPKPTKPAATPVPAAAPKTAASKTAR
jgi:hypothetical protein